MSECSSVKTGPTYHLIVKLEGMFGQWRCEPVTELPKQCVAYRLPLHDKEVGQF